MITVIDYKAGNAPSVMHAITRLGREASFGTSAKDIAKAEKIILPGVGSAKATMDSLRELDLLGALEEAVLDRKTLFLGICVGLQVLFEHSEEEDANCLGWIKGSVIKFEKSKVRVPQMGWNYVKFCENISRNDYYYFVNSYHAVPKDESVIWGEADYNGKFTAAIRKDNIYATQFHTEKSGEAGLALLEDFLCLQND